MSLGSQSTEDFSGGMYRGRRAPANAVYDLVNGFLNEDRQIYSRSGTAYQSNVDAGETLLGLTTPQLPVGPRTISWGASGLHVLNEDDATPFAISGESPRALSRAAGLNGLLAFPSASGGYAFLYGGARALDNYLTGTVSVTSGSETVTGSGTLWASAPVVGPPDGPATNVVPGMIFATGDKIGVVLKVVSDTELTLTAPWGATAAGAAYSANVKTLTGDIAISSYSESTDVYVAAVGAVPRLLITAKQRVYFSDRGDPVSFDPTIYHELPAGVAITGAAAIEDTALIFTTDGVWAIQNMSLDPIDAYGNVQHTVSKVNELVLWGDPGLSTWSGMTVVPAVDDVYLMPLGAPPQPISGDRGSQWDDGIRALYRGYVSAGYSAGTAVVHRGHYLLPIVDGTALVDVLVCNLAGGFVWSRLVGHAADIAYSQRVSVANRTPQLLGVSAQRILALTGCFEPSTEHVFDADGTIFDTTIITRDYPTGQQPGIFTKARARYEQVNAGFGGDNFDRPDENPLANGWLRWAGNAPKVVSGVCVADGGGFDDATRPNAIGPDCTITALLAVPLAPTTNIGLGLRLTTHTAAANGYMMETRDIGSGPEVILYKGSDFTEIATASSIPAGVIDGASLVITGSTLFGLLRIDGVWTEVVTVTGQSDYPLAGFPGFWVIGANGITQISWGGTGAVPLPVKVAFTSDADAGVFTDLTDTGEQGGADGWGVSDGSKYQWATVGKRRERGRFRITVPGGAASFVLRSIEILSRSSGKQ